MLLLIGVWIFFMRQMQSGSGRAMGFGRSRAKLLNENKNKVTFKDVAGQKFERTGYNPLENFSNYNMSTQSRLVRYSDFEQM